MYYLFVRVFENLNKLSEYSVFNLTNSFRQLSHLGLSVAKKPSQHERKDSQNNRKMFENVETNYH